ncbi:MAG: hypothetical protein Q9166_008108 [cf. Caloplaca sp. 2 TL-2023]
MALPPAYSTDLGAHHVITTQTASTIEIRFPNITVVSLKSDEENEVLAKWDEVGKQPSSKIGALRPLWEVSKDSANYLHREYGWSTSKPTDPQVITMSQMLDFFIKESIKIRLSKEFWEKEIAFAGKE